MATAKKVTKKKVTKKKTTKKIAKKVKKTAKKVAKKKVSTKKAKKVVAKKELTEEQIEAKEEKELRKKLDKEFQEMPHKGTIHVALDDNGNLLIKKVSDHDAVNDVINNILKAFETRLIAEQLAPVFNQPIFENMTRQ